MYLLSSPWNSPGQNTGVSSFSLLQGIFPTQGSNPCLLHWRRILYQLSCKRSPRILEWVAYPFSRGSSRSRNWTGVSCFAGEGNGTPLQYSCLENPMDGGAWWAAVHGVARVGHDWATSLSLFTFLHWRRKWQPTPVFLPGESQGRGSLVGCRLWGRTESDTTEVTKLSLAPALQVDSLPSELWSYP